MKIRKVVAIGIIALIAAGIFAASSLPEVAGKSARSARSTSEPIEVEVFGNCLSFPVIWAEGIEKVLRGVYGTTTLDGQWWYWWGTDSDGNPLSCLPDPDNKKLCDDEESGTANGNKPGDGVSPIYKAYNQQDQFNVWQAGSTDAHDRVQVDLIDWGDNLESVNWYTKSKVRTEVVLFEDSTVNSENDTVNEPFPMLQYDMKHLYGLGIDEMWGLSTTFISGQNVTEEVGPEERNKIQAKVKPRPEEVDPNTQATVYSHCARLTIQKLLVEREDPLLADLIWVPEEGWTEPDGSVDLINDQIFNRPVWEMGVGPSYFSAEINVKGKVMYGYNWDLSTLNDQTGGSAAGDYRVTFSFDDYCGLNNNGPPLNTFFTDINGNPVAQIMELAEVEGVTVTELSSTESDDSDDGGGTVGATGMIDYENGLTYMDIRILEKGGGGG
jgi:hypothetical protein